MDMWIRLLTIKSGYSHVYLGMAIKALRHNLWQSALSSTGYTRTHDIFQVSPPRISSQISANSRQCQHSSMLTHRQLDRGVGVFRIASELPFLRWGQVELHAITCAHGILNMSALEAAIQKEELTASFPIIHLLFHSQSATSGTCQTEIPFLMRSKCGQYFSHIFAMRWPPLHKTEPIEIPKMQTIWQSKSTN